MGHVDHGKTTLLDVIRKAKVAEGEAGGITQHIGAYSVSVPSHEKGATPKKITFLDTPGHEAFTAMRSRGANVTDLVILVVAGSEGLMPQTIEAIHHARAAQVPILVALTKMDLEAAQKMKDRVKKQLQEHDLASEDWGGKTVVVEVSATKNTGIDQLLEMILLQTEMMELKTEKDSPAEGNVIEAQMEAGRGTTATVLVRKGTLHLGDPFVVTPYWGKVKALIDDQGKMVKEAGPSTPIKIVGLSGVPLAGVPFQVVESESEARDHSERELEKQRSDKLEGPKRLTLEDLLTSTSDQRKTLKIILKTDVQGSAEALLESFKKLPQDKINVDVIHHAVGPITESDVLLATASKALVVGFQVKVDSNAAELAKSEGVQIQLFRIIYELIDKVREFMSGLLDPEIKFTSVGSAEIKQVFEVSKGGRVAGCLVTQGRIERKARARLLRKRNIIFEGAIGTLRRFQDDVSDVRSGLECGLRLEGFDDYEPGDVIEFYHIEKISAKL
jgi:translation initiation factor IF-2